MLKLIDKGSSSINGSYKLIDVYRRLFKRDPVDDAHSAEGDAMILLKCVVATKSAVNFNETQLYWNYVR